MSGGAATERLYYTDSYLEEFTARVVDRADGGRRVYLDRTAFYPTSGGQPNDTGIIAASNVVDVIDEGDRIAHLLDAPLDEDEVRGRIYWTRRFDHMQQHTGQHLLSAVFEDLVGARTVSVHFGEESSTLDLETDALPAKSLDEAVERANLIVVENRPVSVTFEDAATVTGLRKAVDRTGELRVIGIADLDRSACGGTHVRSTGEIGAILLRGIERVRKSIRVEFVCGRRAVARARADYLALRDVAATLSTSLDSVGGVAKAQAAHAKETEQARRRLERDLARYRSAEMHAAATPHGDGVKLVVVEDSGETMDQLRVLAQAMLDRERVVFVGATADGALLVAASEDSGHDAGKLLREALSAVGGKGGGSPRLAQGSTAAGKTADAIRFIRGVPGRGR
ncbi:MAG TPA: DHHA1 domain-containing protein [Gemmatimonadaceae bacterium]|nr:DHHA1 domain-containing protein [Gemmatimonadaceae bacterium]